MCHFSELPENWTDTRETLLEGMVFQLKYLGVTMVEQPKGEELSAAAVKRIVTTVRGRNELFINYSLTRSICCISCMHICTDLKIKHTRRGRNTDIP